MIPEIMTWAEIKSQMLNQLRHPGAPPNHILKHTSHLEKCPTCRLIFHFVGLFVFSNEEVFSPTNSYKNDLEGYWEGWLIQRRQDLLQEVFFYSKMTPGIYPAGVSGATAFPWEGKIKQASLSSTWRGSFNLYYKFAVTWEEFVCTVG